MTIDKPALKALAEAATQGEWTRDTRKFGGVVYGGPIQHWVNGSGQSQVAMTTGADWMRPGETEANADFIAAANPGAVLALLSEIDKLERDARNDLIAYKAVLERQNEIRDECDEQAAQFKEWQKNHHANYCMVAKERDQLKAENDGLTEVNDKLSRRNGMLEENVIAMTETHVLYTWLRKKADQPGHGVIAVAILNGPEWVVSHDLDKDLRALIDAEEP
jgi:hypothetical protein